MYLCDEVEQDTEPVDDDASSADNDAVPPMTGEHFVYLRAIGLL